MISLAGSVLVSSSTTSSRSIARAIGCQRPSEAAAAGPIRSRLSSSFLPLRKVLFPRGSDLDSPGLSRNSSRTLVAAPWVVAMAPTPPLELLVKSAAGNPEALGDCPFSQRVLLTVEEKKLPYSYRLVDTANKPDWFLEANPEGKVPVIQWDGKWVADSDVIAVLLEEAFPEPSLKAPEDKASVGSALFGSFVRFLKSSDPSDGTEAALLSELKALDEALKASGGPYVAGESITSIDLGLAPKLYHLETALGHFKSWTIPKEFEHVSKYIQALFERESWKKTSVDKQVVINGWKRALGVQ